MKRSLLAGLGLLALIAAPASAADLPRQMPYKAPAYVPAFNWTGAYIGLHGGYGFNADGLNMDGGFVGGQIGYNWQAPGSQWVLGIEVDSAWADMSGGTTLRAAPNLISVRSDLDYMGTLRGRIGYAFDRTMLYATGGLAWASNELRVNANAGPFIGGTTQSQTHIGGTVGAGIEHAFAPNWTVKAEYLYTMYDNKTYFGGVAGGVSPDLDTHTVKVGINYLFR